MTTPPAPEKSANIQISLSPAGVTVVLEYTGPISSVASALERLRAAGVVDLVEKSRPAPAPAQLPVGNSRPKAAKVAPEYNGSGEPCCPKHHKPLREGQYGLYCPAKDDTTERGYCALKFQD